jgi:cell wall-associated NlpC family hydrolase
MTLGRFIDTWVGKKADYDKSFGCQCVDLFRYYCQQVLELPHTGGVDGASDLYDKFDYLPLEKKYFERLPAGTSGIKAGDVVVYKGRDTNRYGHVAIVVYPTPSGSVVFEQDGYNQEAGCHLGYWSDERLLGYLRKKIV